MFGGRKVVRTTAGRRFNAAFFKEMIGTRRLEGFLVLEAGALKADDALVKLFEGAAHAAAIRCQGDDPRDLDGLIRQVLSAANLTISADAQRLLVSRLGADRSLTRAELDKLVLYAHGAGAIEPGDVEAIVGDAADLAVDRIVDAAARGDAGRAAIECDRAIASGESPQFVLIAMLRHWQRLHRVRFAIESGVSLDDAVKALRPPVFFKQRDAFLADLDRWPAQRLSRALARLQDAQILTRSGGPYGNLDETVIVQSAVLDVARLAVVKR
jgi:DNA polymerase-3 subunit delta